jgi:hypothetical protein
MHFNISIELRVEDGFFDEETCRQLLSAAAISLELPNLGCMCPCASVVVRLMLYLLGLLEKWPWRQ